MIEPDSSANEPIALALICEVEAAAIRNSRYATFVGIAAILGALACIAIPAWQLVVPGPFDWHLRQPAVWQGGIEALALLALAAGGCAIGGRAALFCMVILPFAFFLRRHAVDVPLLIDLLYLEIIVGLGALARRIFAQGPPGDARSYLQAFTLGIVIWSIVAWTASALDVGSIRTLRALTVLLAVPALFGRHAPLSVFLLRGLRNPNAVARSWYGAMAAWIAILYARTNFVAGFDSLWYGLRGEYVLDPGNSVFQPLGLVSPVHYFPKLYEVFLLPVSALGDSSVIEGVTIWMFVLTLLACSSLARRVGLPERVRLPVLALIATLPALANEALEAKPDVIAVLFVLLAADAALDFVRARSPAAAAWFVAWSALACAAKLTAIPYVGVMLLVSGIAAWRLPRRAPNPVDEAHAGRLAIAAAIASLIVLAFVTARTWLLCGMPTIGPDALFRLWTALGMSLKAPAGTLHWTLQQDWSDVPALIADWLFRPQRLEHVVITWVGNVWLWCAALAMLAIPLGHRRMDQRGLRWPLVALMLTGATLALAIRYHVRGSDGNYFLAALLPAILLGATAAFTRLAAAPRAFAVALACLPAFVLFQGTYAFVSAAWTPGTRTFDIDLGRGWHDSRRQRWAEMDEAGLERIGHALKQLRGDPRVVGYAYPTAALRLPARWESLVTVSYSRPEYVNDPQRFLRFLRDEGIDYLILPKVPMVARDFDIKPAVSVAAQELEADPTVRRVDDRNYVLLDLSAAHRRDAALPAGAHPLLPPAKDRNR